MPKQNDQTTSTDKPTDISSEEQLKKLEQENLYLRIEIAYLKELRRLRLEEERGTNKPQDPSATSKENSN